MEGLERFVFHQGYDPQDEKPVGDEIGEGGVVLEEIGDDREPDDVEQLDKPSFVRKRMPYVHDRPDNRFSTQFLQIEVFLERGETKNDRPRVKTNKYT